MTITEGMVWGLTIGGFTSLGGYFLVKTLVQSGIEKAVEYNFNKRIEGRKTALKKSEVYFQRQLEALSAIHMILRRLLPKRSHPDMDWRETCEEIANGFSGHHDSIIEYLCEYESVLPKDVAQKLDHAADLASDGTFQFVWDSELKMPEVTVDAIDTADKMYNAIKAASESLQEHVNIQVNAE